MNFSLLSLGEALHLWCLWLQLWNCYGAFILHSLDTFLFSFLIDRHFGLRILLDFLLSLHLCVIYFSVGDFPFYILIS
jgi:hypothetical protein